MSEQPKGSPLDYAVGDSGGRAHADVLCQKSLWLAEIVKIDEDAGADEASASPPVSESSGGKLSCLQVWSQRVIPAGGHVSNIFNMASNILGIGIVGMSDAFNESGVVLAMILMVVCCLMVVFSFYLIGRTCQATPYRGWESASRHLLFPGMDYVAAGIMMLLQMGGMTSYVISTNDLLLPFLPPKGMSASADFLHTNHGRRLLTATVWFFGMFLLSLPRRVSSLRYFSLVGVLLVVYFVFAVVVRSSMDGLPYVHDMNLVASGLDAVNGLTTFIFAFLGHGLCFRLYDEMPKRSARHLAIDGACAVSLVATLYILVGFFGYAAIGPTISGSIFQYYDVRTDMMMMVAYIGILLKICVTYALSSQSCRLPIFYCIGHSLDTAPYWLVLLVTIATCLMTLVLGLFIPDVTLVFSLLGSICGGVLAFLLPVFFVFYIGGWTLPKVGWLRLGMTYLNMVGGVVAIVFGTAVTIDSFAKR